eukprot:Rhum_TRINITY_DN14075_c2_g1::Rhum_TRINITY_DN14075_c2_g1_i1::g.68440::m.68440
MPLTTSPADVLSLAAVSGIAWEFGDEQLTFSDVCAWAGADDTDVRAGRAACTESGVYLLEPEGVSVSFRTDVCAVYDGSRLADAEGWLSLETMEGAVCVLVPPERLDEFATACGVVTGGDAKACVDAGLAEPLAAAMREVVLPSTAAAAAAAAAA